MKLMAALLLLLWIVSACALKDSKPDPKASYGGSYQIRGSVSSGTTTGK